MIDLHVLSGTRPAAVGEALTADPVEDPVELRFADFEGIVVPLEAGPIVEIDRQGRVDAHRSEMRDRALVFEAKNPGKEPRRLFLVAGRDDRVVEDDGQERLLSTVFDKMSPFAAIDKHQRLAMGRYAQILPALYGGSGARLVAGRLQHAPSHTLNPTERQEWNLTQTAEECGQQMPCLSFSQGCY